jgi:hypothetical protein
MSVPTAPSIDREWARSLIGLRLQVESCWWDGFDGHELNPASVVDVDFDDSAGRFWIFQCDGDCYTYQMRYDAVLHYADETHPNFYKF